MAEARRQIQHRKCVAGAAVIRRPLFVSTQVQMTPSTPLVVCLRVRVGLGFFGWSLCPDLPIITGKSLSAVGRSEASLSLSRSMLLMVDPPHSPPLRLGLGLGLGVSSALRECVSQRFLPHATLGYKGVLQLRCCKLAVVLVESVSLVTHSRAQALYEWLEVREVQPVFGIAPTGGRFGRSH
jgi:hypothetical protein